MEGRGQLLRERGVLLLAGVSGVCFILAMCLQTSGVGVSSLLSWDKVAAQYRSLDRVERKIETEGLLGPVDQNAVNMEGDLLALDYKGSNVMLDKVKKADANTRNADFLGNREAIPVRQEKEVRINYHIAVDDVTDVIRKQQRMVSTWQMCDLFVRILFERVIS